MLLERRKVSLVSVSVAKVTHEAIVLITFVLHGGHGKWSSRQHAKALIQDTWQLSFL